MLFDCRPRYHCHRYRQCLQSSPSFHDAGCLRGPRVRSVSPSSLPALQLTALGPPVMHAALNLPSPSQAPAIVVSAAEGELHVSGHEISYDSDPSRVTIQLCPSSSAWGSRGTSPPPSRIASSDNLAGRATHQVASTPPVISDSQLISTMQSETTAEATAGSCCGAVSCGGGSSSDGQGANSGSLAAQPASELCGGSVFFTPLHGAPVNSSSGSALGVGVGHGSGHARGHSWGGTLGQCSYRSTTFGFWGQVHDEQSHPDGADCSPDLHTERSRERKFEGRQCRRSVCEEPGCIDRTPLLPSVRSQLPDTVMRVLDRTPLERAPPEVLVYMPGFNATLLDGITVCGQLLCLADFPPHLKAFMFSWPGGRELSYFTALNYSSSPRNQADFAAFFASIIDSGVREVGVVASCSIRLFIRSVCSLCPPRLSPCPAFLPLYPHRAAPHPLPLSWCARALLRAAPPRTHAPNN